MSSSGNVLPYPRGKSSDQLYEHSKTLVDALQRILANNETIRRLGLVEDQLGDVETTVADVESTTNTLASNYTSILAQVGTNTADIADLFDALNGVGGSGLTPQQAFILALVSATSSVLGSVSQQVQEAKALTEKLAQAAIAETIRGRLDGAQIKVEQAVRTTETLSLAQQVTTLNADLGAANAAITAEITARTNGDSANATAITNLTTTVNGNTSQLTTLQGSVDGISAYSTTAINLNGQVVGLQSLSGGPAGSVFEVLVNAFRVASTASNGVPVFAIDAVTGNVGIRGDLLVTGSVAADAIGVSELSAFTANLGTVNAGLIRNGADTIRFDLPAMRIYRTDGTMDLDFANKRFVIDF